MKKLIMTLFLAGFISTSANAKIISGYDPSTGTIYNGYTDHKGGAHIWGSDGSYYHEW